VNAVITKGRDGHMNKTLAWRGVVASCLWFGACSPEPADYEFKTDELDADEGSRRGVEGDRFDYAVAPDEIVYVLDADNGNHASGTGACVVNVAMGELDGGPDEVGESLEQYPYALGNYLFAGEAWCSEFVSWVYRICDTPFTGGYEGGWMLKSSLSIREWFQSRDRWLPRSGVPSPGDYVRYNTDSGGHSGLVRAVQGTTLYTVEGNVSNQVMARVIRNYPTYSMLDGFGQLGT
jgi:hypothetical protein